MRMRKTHDVWDIEGHYGCGWEIIDCRETRLEARASLDDYNANEPGVPHRIVKRREKIDDVIKGDL